MLNLADAHPRPRPTPVLVTAFLALATTSTSSAQDRPVPAVRPASADDRCSALLPKIEPAGPAPAAGGVRRRRALLVGITRYAELGSKNGMWPSLRTGCDVPLMRRALMDRFGFQDGDIRTLTEGQATKQGIDRAFREHLIEGAGPGDVVVFYFSGHGQLVPDEEAFGGLRGSLVTANYTAGTGPAGRTDNLRSDEVRELLRALKMRMAGPDGKVVGNITVLFDSCHSGNGTKGDLQEKGRPWDPAIDGPIPQPRTGLGSKGEIGTKDPFSDFDRDAVIAEGYVFISACRNYEVAFCPKAGTEASIFTYHLAQHLARATPQTTYRDLFEDLSVDITAAQVPQLEGDTTKLLLAGAAVAGERYLVVQAVDGKHVTLPVGFVQGVAEGSRYALYRPDTSVRDPRNKLGEARVVDVATATSTAQLEGPGADQVKPEELREARAVELERGFGDNPLYVVFDGVARPEAELKPYRMLTTVDDQGRPITRDNYHVRVRLAGTLDPVSGKEVLVDPATGKDVVVPAKGEAKPRTDLIWVQARNGDVLDELPADDRAAGAIAEALFDEWKTRYLAEYLKREDDPNQTINVKLVVDAVTVKRDNNRGGFHVTGVRTDINPAGTLRLRDGDYIQLAVQNTSLASVPVFVTVLRIGRDGVFPIYPIKGAPNDSLAANRLEPAKTPYPLPFLVRATKPYGTDLYKVIATKEPADFSGLLARRRLPPGVGDKGEEAAKAQAELAKLPPPVHSLARLLQEVKDGRKGGEPVIIGTEWATDEKYVEVVAPGKN